MKSSAQHVPEHCKRERQKTGYDHEKVKEEIHIRVAAICICYSKCPLNPYNMLEK